MPRKPLTDHEKFRRDMKKAGRRVFEYHGRYMWHGPAVEAHVNERQTIIRETTIEIQWDNMGKEDLVYYPKSYA